MLDITDLQVVTRLISEISSSEEIDRKRDSFNSYQIYSGNVIPYVKAELKRVRPKAWTSYTVSDISVSRMITDKLGCAYKQMPHRSVVNESDSNTKDDDKTEILQEIYFQAKADRQFKEFDRTLNRERHALMWLTYRLDKEKYELMSLQPYEYSVVRDKDFGDLKAVILQYPDSTITHEAQKGDGFSTLIADNQADSAAQSKVYALWTDTHHVVVKVYSREVRGARGKIKVNVDFVPMPENPQMINPIGILPFVYISKDNAVDYPTTSPLAQQTVTFNAMWSELLTSANIQGSGQLIVKYPEEMQGKIDNLTHGLTSAIELPQSSTPNAAPTDATYISPSPDLNGQKDSYLSYLKLVLSENGIASSQGLDGGVEQFSSGLERLIAQADVQSIIQENQNTYYVHLEKHLFKILKAWEVANQKNRFADNDYLIVKFEKPKVMISDSEILTNIEKMFQLGIIEKWEMLQKIDPNLTDDEARDKLARIELERNERARGFLNGNQENTEV